MSDRDSMPDDLRESARIKAACSHCDTAKIVHEVVMCEEFTDKRRHEVFNDFLAGYDHAMECGHGELLAENTELQSERFDLSMGQWRIIRLEQFFGDCITGVLEHAENCDCFVCIGIRKVNELEEHPHGT